MIIVAHLLLFAVLFGLGFSGLNGVFGDGGIAFHGGLIATLVLAIAAELVVLAASVAARALALALKINPLTQRPEAEAIAHAIIFVALTVFLMVLPLVLPALVTLSWYWAPFLSAVVVAFLEVMVRVKRHLIARSAD